jgi:hypothetical protein
MYATIDSSVLGDVPWQCMVTEVPDVDEHAPSWKRTSYEVWYRDPEIVVSNMLSNPDFDGQFDICPYVELDANGERRWSNVMSGNIAWRRSVRRTFVSFKNCELTTTAVHYRMKSLRQSQIQRVECTVRSFSGATRQQFLLRLDMSSTTLCIYPSVIHTIPFDVGIGTR